MSNEIIELLQIALGNRQCFSSPVSGEGWHSLFEESIMYSVVGIAYAGVSRVYQLSASIDTNSVPLPKQLLVEWSVQANIIRDENIKADKLNCKVMRNFSRHGFKGCILKGQGNISMYDNVIVDGHECSLGSFRSCGDIDVWLGGSHNAVYEYVKSVCKPQAMMYNHTDFPVRDDLDIEVHIRPTYMNNPIHNQRLQEWYDAQKPTQINNILLLGEEECAVPKVSFNAVYQLSHLYKHLFTTGITLRQLLDYYFVVKRLSEHSKEERQETICVIKRVGMESFASAVMWTMAYLFAMPEQYMIVDPNEKRGRMLISEIERSNADIHAGIGVGEDTGTNYWRRVVSEQKRNWRLLAYYPSEVLCKPIFAIYHFFWRKLNLVRDE